jgi:hypothetical protein
MGHHFPLASGALHIEDAIENFSEIDFHRMPKAFRLGKERLENLPLRVTQVAGIGFTRRMSNFR